MLCARLAGDPSRPTALRSAAAAACPLLGTGVYLSYSRGAIAAGAVGLILLLAAAPTRPQLRAVLAALLSSVLAGACAAAFRGVASLQAAPARRSATGR